MAAAENMPAKLPPMMTARVLCVNSHMFVGEKKQLGSNREIFPHIPCQAMHAMLAGQKVCPEHEREANCCSQLQMRFA